MADNTNDKKENLELSKVLAASLAYTQKEFRRAKRELIEDFKEILDPDTGEKIKILQTTLSKGENQYQQRLEDIKILNYSIADLKCTLRIVKSQASQIDDLRKEIISLNKQLLTEKLGVKALSEELENPLNYHRWRKLEGTDPDTWEMLQKIQTLQKRLIKKTEEVVEKDVII